MTMPQADTRSLVERYIAAFNEGDHDAMLSMVTEDVIHDMRDGTREIGRDKLRWRLALTARHFRESWADAVIMVAPDGRRAAAEITLRGTYAETLEELPPADGQRYSLAAGLFFEIDGALIARTTTYVNEAAWHASLKAG